MGRHHARAGVIGQTNAGDVAFCHVAARLLAVGPICIRGRDIAQRCLPTAFGTARRPYLFSRVVSSPWSCRRKIAVICSRGGVRGYHIRSRNLMEALCAHSPIAPITLRLSNALVSYAKYLLLTFWPNDLAVSIIRSEAGIPAWQIIGAALLLIGITAFCFFQRKIRPYLIVGWLWFLGTLVPVIGLVQVGGQTMADRYFYIPSIGLFIALVFGLADIAKRRRVAPWLSAAIANVVLLVLATLTNAQIHRWRDSFTLFKHALAVTPPNVRIEDSLGLAMGESDRSMKPRRILRRPSKWTR